MSPDVRSEVESLLAAADQGDDLTALDRRRASDLLRADEVDDLPNRFGPYRILREIGQGGMGTVLLAERADDEFEQRVAIKIVNTARWSPEAIERFRTERQVLAGLDHPNIARLLDGGSTADGIPYVVMEYIDGRPLDVYCAEEGLDVHERIDLVRRLCSAVESAHVNLVIHRDIKPANVLVTADGVPKLLDFGIAKLLTSEGDAQTAGATNTERLATPGFASPEQIAGRPLTTRTDVYSLGALIFHLLVGEPPPQPDPVRSDREVLDDVPEGAPPLRLPHRDLEAILRKALCLDPGGRYVGAMSLSDDLERFLENRPIEARHPTVGYRASRFFRRHRAACLVAVAGALLFGSSLGLFLQRLSAERDRARLEAAKLERVKDFLIDLFHATDAGDDVSARQLLAQGAARLEADLDEQPEVVVELQTAISEAYEGLALFDESRRLAEQAVEQARRTLGEQHRSTLAARAVLGTALGRQGRHEEAEALLVQAISDLERSGEAARDTALHAKMLHNLAVLELARSNDTRSADLLEEALTLRRRLRSEPSREVAQTLASLAITYRRLDRSDDAELVSREAIEIYDRVLPAGHPEVARVHNNLGVLYSRSGRSDLAEVHYRKALATYESAFGDRHTLTAGTLGNLAELLMNQGRSDEALPLAIRCHQALVDLVGAEHQMVGSALNTLAHIDWNLGRIDSARSRFHQAISIYETSLGSEHPWIAFPTAQLGKMLGGQGETTTARDLLERALEIRRATYGPTHSQVAFSLEDLGDHERDHGSRSSALQNYRAALEVRLGLDQGQESHLRRLEDKIAEIEREGV